MTFAPTLEHITRNNNPARNFSSQHLENLYFFGVIFIYLPLLPIGNAETQPFIWLFVVLLGAPWLLLNGNQRINTFSLYGFAFATIIWARLWVDSINGTPDIAFSVKYIFIILCLCTSFLVKSGHTRTALNCVIIAHVIVLGISIIPGLNSAFSSAMTMFFGRYSGDLFDVRGLSYFAPEPSYAAICLGGLLALDQIEKAKSYKRIFDLRTGTIIILLMSTKALMGAVILLIFGLSFLIGRPSLVKTICAAAGAALVGIVSLNSGRVSQLLEMLKAIDWSQLDLETSLTAISLVEASGSTRLITNSSAFLGGIKNWHGNGIGSYGQQWVTWADAAGWQLLERHEVLGDAYKAGLPATNHSVIANLTFEVGAIFIIWYLAFLSYVFINKEMKHRWTCFWYVFLLTIFLSLFQYQITNPMIWYIFIVYKAIYTNSAEETSPATSLIKLAKA